MVTATWFARARQPSNLFAIACISISVLCLSGAWKIQSLKKSEEERARRASREVKSASSHHALDNDSPVPPRLQDLHGKITALMTLLGKQISICRELNAQAVRETYGLTEELSPTIKLLCRIQQLVLLNGDVFEVWPGLKAVLEVILNGYLAIASKLNLQLGNVQACSNANRGGFVGLIEQLREQRESLVFVADSIARRNTLESGSITFGLDASTLVEETHLHSTNVKQYIEQSPPEDELPKYTPLANGRDEAPDTTVNYAQVAEANSLRNNPPDPLMVSKVATAVINDDNEGLKSLIEDVDANAVHGELKRTAIHHAARLNRIECAKTLIRNGAMVDQVDGTGDAAMHLACWEGHVEVMQVLIDSGAKIDAISGRDGNSPLFCAILGRNIDVARLLLLNMARVNVRSTADMTALHQAAITGQSAMCELLLEKGADVNVADTEGNTPLHYAATNGDVRTAKVLLAAQADINARQEIGLRPIHWAVLEDNHDMLRTLLDMGADVDAISDGSATPLHCAAAQGSIGCVKVLLRYEANSQIRTVDWNGMQGTPESIALETKHTAIARMIKKATRRKLNEANTT